MRLTFATKLTLLVMLAVVLTSGIIGYSLAATNLTALKNSSRELYLSVAQNVQDRIQSRVDAASRLLVQASSTLTNTQLSPENALKLTAEMVAAERDVEALAVYDARGELLEVISKGRAAAFPKRLPSSIALGIRFDTSHTRKIPRPFVGTPERLTTTALPGIPIAVQWALNGSVQGVLLTVVDNESLCRIVADVSGRTFGGAQHHVYLVDDTRNLVAHVEQGRVRDEESLAGKGIFSTIAFSTDKRVGISAEYGATSGEEMLGTFVTVPTLGMAIVVEQTQAIAYKPYYAMRLNVVMWGLVSLVVGVMLSVMISRQFAKPIRQLIAVSERLAVQDFSVRLPEDRADELSRLFRVQNRVAEELARYQQININRIISERNKLEAVVRQASDGVMIVDSSHTVLVLNEAFASWFALPQTENIPLEQAVTNEALKTQLLAVFASEQHVTPVEFRLQRAGEVRGIVLRGSMVRVVVDGELAAMTTIVRDVTKEVEIDRMKTELVGIVAHELRSPLHSIIGMSELIGEGALTHEDTVDFANRITKQAHQLSSIITKFLDLNRIESGKTELRQIPFHLNEVLQSVLKVNMRLAEKKGIQVHVHTPNKLTPIVGDPDLIGQVMVNLFSNAVKYSGEGTSVFVEVLEKSDKILFSIQDHGYGISESSKAKLFTKFFRATDDERVRQQTGTGLGLAFVKEILEHHGGELGVDTRLNAGSTFWFSLPK
jgi:signal transduction histidine kinase